SGGGEEWGPGGGSGEAEKPGDGGGGAGEEEDGGAGHEVGSELALLLDVGEAGAEGAVDGGELLAGGGGEDLGAGDLCDLLELGRGLGRQGDGEDRDLLVAGPLGGGGGGDAAAALTVGEEEDRRRGALVVDRVAGPAGLEGADDRVADGRA